MLPLVFLDTLLNPVALASLTREPQKIVIAYAAASRRWFEKPAILFAPLCVNWLEGSDVQ
jgi:hypothetical protein